MEEILESLNPSQQEAVTTTEGIVRVIAGAGSGKTRALTHRFAWLVQEMGILPGSILCVTFTNKAAAEMRSRIHEMIGDQDTGYISTFHSFCNTILLEESHAIHYPRSFMVLDNSDIDAFLQSIYEERGLTSRDMTFSKARDMIEMKKLQEVPDYHQILTSLSLEEARDRYLRAREADDIIFYGYLYHERKNFALDYNDLIILTLQIFRENPEIALKWQQRLEYIMIDEFQDIDELQYRLMEVLQGYHHNLFVVGDPDQTIYTWRGARVSYLTEFDHHFPGTQTIFLNENYRSTPQIVQAANHLVDVNQDRIRKDLISMNLPGPSVRAAHFKSAREEALFLASQITELHDHGLAYKDMVILYRAHYMSRTLEEVFLEQQIPYTIYSGVQFFQRMEIKDALSLMRMLVWKSDLDFERIVNKPKRSIGRRRMAWLREKAAETGKSLYETLQDSLDTDLFKSTQAAEFVNLIENLPWKEMGLSEVLSAVLDQSGYEKMLRLEGAQERMDNLAELKQAISEYELTAGEDVSLEMYLNHAALLGSADQDMNRESVKMMTIHTAKGLEFECVMIVGMNEGMFPTRQVRTLQQMEEERRLAFVAMTRARSRLILTDAEGKLNSGAYRLPSRFLLDIGEENLLWQPAPSPELLERTQKAIASRPGLLAQAAKGPGWSSGDRIRHKVFGEGTILEVDEAAQSMLVSFDKLNTQRRLSLHVKLEKIGHEETASFLH